MRIVNILCASMLFTFKYIHVGIKSLSLFNRMIFNDFTFDLMVDAQEMDILEDAPVFRPLVNQHPDISVTDSEKNIKFFFSPDISCPEDGCPPAQLYATKASFQRHWTEKHLPEVISYTCPVGQCWVSCRRCYDMKVLFLRIHNAKKEFVENIPSKSQKSSKPTQSISTRNLGLSSAGPANLILLPCC